MFSMPIEDVQIEAGPVRFTCQSDNSDGQAANDFDEVIIEDVTDEEYPKYTSNTGETLPTFPELNEQTKATLKRKIEEKQAETASKQVETSSKVAEPPKDPVVQQFDIEAWFKKPDWKTKPQVTSEVLKKNIES